MIERTFHITTFGCQMNVSDSDWLTRSLVARGFTPVSADEAKIHILNTCSVRDKPEQKVYSEIGRIRHITNDSPDVLVCVGGCVAQQVGEKLFKRFRQVRLVFGTDGIASAPGAIERLAAEPGTRVSLLDFMDHFEERPLGLTREGGENAAIPPAAYVSIMQGCDNFCAYCIVPYVRGRQKSREAEAILDECRTLIANGAREITLLGQNVNAFGLDTGKGRGAFGDLLYRVAELPGLSRLRFITPHPKDMGPEVAKAFADIPHLAPRLHLPLQSGSDRILKRMGRRYDTARFMDLVDGLRAARPEIQFSTDIIVGFPGETEEDFAETLAFMRKVGFVASFSFAYSDRPGTKASLFPEKLDKDVKLERLARLQQWQYEHSRSVLESMLGETVHVMLEAEAEDKDPVPGAVYRSGRDERGHSVIVRMPAAGKNAAAIGDIVPVTVTGSSMHGLKGEMLEP